MASTRKITAGALGLGAAVGLGIGAYHSAHVTLPQAMRQGLARALGVEPGAVTIGAVHVDLSGLTIDSLSAGPLAARRVRFRPTLDTLLGGHLEGRLLLQTVVYEDPPLPGLGGVVDRVEIDRAEIALHARDARVVAHGIRTVLADGRSPALLVDELAVDLDRIARAPRRAAFTGLSVGPLEGFCGSARLDGGQLELRAAAPSAKLTGHLSALGGDATIELSHTALAWQDAPLAARLGVPSGKLVVSGRLHASQPLGRDDGPARFEVELLADEGELRVPRLAPDAIAAAGTALTAHGALRDGDGPPLVVDARLVHKDITLLFDGRLDADQDDQRTLAAEITLPTVGCRALLTSLPPALRRALDGMGVDGDLGGKLRLKLPLADAQHLSLDGELVLGCRVQSEPPLADAGRLRDTAPTLPAAVDGDGQPRRVELGPSNRSFRRLDQIPPRVVGTFVEAEDGRFWQHKGIDLTQIRRALAHDFEIGAPGRGGSTITQQVAKNLFLSGERTLGRKLEESALAWRLEARLGKRRILELYLNLVELGPGIYGVGEGARHYFHKDVGNLTLDEAAQLAALLPAPRRGMDDAWGRRLDQLRARLPGLDTAEHASAALPGKIQ